MIGNRDDYKKLCVFYFTKPAVKVGEMNKEL